MNKIILSEGARVTVEVECAKCRVRTTAQAYLKFVDKVAGVFDGCVQAHCSCGGDAPQIPIRAVVPVNPTVFPVVKLAPVEGGAL